MSSTTGYGGGSSPPRRGNASSPPAPTARRSTLREISIANEGDGSRMDRPIIAGALRIRPNQDFTYLVHEHGLPGRWLLTERMEAQYYHSLGYDVYNSFEPFTQVTEWVDPAPAPTGTPFAAQQQEVSNVFEAEEEANDPEYAEWKKKKKKQGEGKIVKSSTPKKNGTKSPPGSGGSKKGSPGGGAGAGAGVTA